eukprot:TRINITY_DN323_c0_g1_i4.p1 TRINITY_DN323_c0_g1~~TRINITY_DN323_c0_g1_i4.p1  ORF type:complete len:499 (-),score=200.56 TRINITY_DN323_c0_g1_i4:93-1589(-)
MALARTSHVSQQRLANKAKYTQLHSEFYSTLISTILKEDQDLTLPLTPDSFLLSAQSGVVFCKLVNKISPGKINRFTTRNPNVYQKSENQRAAIDAAIELGCKAISFTPTSLIDGNLISTLGFTWQLLRLWLVKGINVHEKPQLKKLKQENESEENFSKLTVEQHLLRWFNYHLQIADPSRKITNFTTDLNDGSNYTVLLNHFFGDEVPLSLLNGDAHQRAGHVLTTALHKGAQTVVTAEQLVTEVDQFHLAFVASLFNLHDGLSQSNSNLAGFKSKIRHKEDEEDHEKEKIKRETELMNLKQEVEQLERAYSQLRKQKEEVETSLNQDEESKIRKIEELEGNIAELVLEKPAELCLLRVDEPDKVILSLFLTIQEARQIAKADIFSESDPYVIVRHFKPDGTQVAKWKTRFIDDSPNPVWNETMRISNIGMQDTIDISVWDYDSLTSNDFLGEVKLARNQIVNGMKEWYPLRYSSHSDRRTRLNITGDIKIEFDCYY